ncbi:MAG TPA: c-type cytochrome biogenesis protein CcmI [Pyrinomonadaceae bacterium]|nr:c-type cytochrome biogenesis protein CcmI [Pyrinomonadaceae bacterium]
MIVFWLICAAFILIALAFILPPALQHSEESDRKGDDERKLANIAVYRDQLAELKSDLQNGIVSEEQYAQDRDEIERRLLEDTKGAQPEKKSEKKTEKKPTAAAVSARNTAYALGIGIPFVAIVFYLNVGTPKSITGAVVTNAPTSSAPAPRTQEQIDANVAALAKRLESNPSDAQGWTMLARSYSSMERFAESAGAYAKATELTPNNADLWAEYAFATAMASGRSLEGKPMELIQRALKVEPENAKALQLAGSAAFQAKDYKKAVGYWERVLKQVPPGSEVAQTIQSRIDEAKTLAAGNSNR